MSWPARTIAALLAVLALLSIGWRIHAKADAAGYARALGEQAQAALATSEKRRIDERALTITNQGITNAFIADKTRRAAADSATADRLREYEAAADRATSAAPPASRGTDGPFAEIAMECVRAFTVLDGTHRSVAAVASGLQSYAGRVCVAPP